jgi:hypothetical protein
VPTKSTKGRCAGTESLPCSGMPENDMACPVLVVIDAQAARDHLQILDPPIARIPPHFGDKFRRVRHTQMVSQAVPFVDYIGTRVEIDIRVAAQRLRPCAGVRRVATGKLR